MTEASAPKATERVLQLLSRRVAGFRIGGILWVLVLFVVGWSVVSSSTPAFKTAYIFAALYGVGAVALTTLQGWAGQGSLVVAGLYLIGGYCVAVIPSDMGKSGVVLGLLLAAAAGAVFGVICSLPARRLSGVYLLLGTLALQYIISDLGNKYQSDHGALGGYPVPTLLLTQNQWLVISFAFLLLTVLYFRRLGRSRVGRSAVLIRNDVGAAQVSGVAVTGYLRWMFVVTSVFMALAGAVVTYYTTTVSYNAYDVNLSVEFLVMIVLFGLGSLWGAVAGAFFVVVLAQLITQLLTGTNGVSADAAYIIQLVYGVAGFLAVLLVGRVANPLPVTGRAASSLPTWLRLPSRGSGADGAAGPTLVDALRSRFDDAWARTKAAIRRGPVWAHNYEDAGAVGAARKAEPANPDGVGVRLAGVGIHYGGAEAIRDVNLEIPAGKTFALVGRNGAGKTSLLLSITGFPNDSGARLHPSSVVQLTRGSEVADMTRMAPDGRSRLGISFVPADGKVFASLTADEHITLAARNAKRSVSEVRELLGVFSDLQASLDRPAGLLSGGQKQQLALLCALATRPRVLVVDELTLGLSPSATKRVVQALTEIQGGPHGPTLILAEQSVAVAFELADTVCLVDNGKVLAAEPPSEEFENRVRRTYVGMAEQSR
jgi:branched-chain amino acid transport system permease protein